MVADHARLDELLTQVAVNSAAIGAGAYQEFRKRLLRHIGIEEKILWPAAQRGRGGEPLSLAERFKLDHGALAALMMLPPSAATVRAVRAILDVHNPLEEAPRGAYEQCESAAGRELDELLDRCRRAAEVSVSPWVASPKVLAAAKRALTRAGYDASMLDQRAEVLE